MSLYLQTEVEKLALEKWGGQEKLDAERAKRHEKRLDRERAKAESAVSTGSADASSSQLDAAAPSAEPAQRPAGADVPAQEEPTLQPSALPSFIRERIRDCSTNKPVSTLEPPAGEGKHVLYWMRTALRGHENPALDVARAVAGGQGLPLLVAAFVLRSHTYPTERRYQFILQGLHDTQLELREQGVELLIHVDGLSGPQKDGWKALMDLAAASSLVITEEMPTSPYAQWSKDLREQLPASVPMWAVDTACLYPMQLTARAPAKAYIFRSSTDRPRRERILAMPYSSGARNWANFLASCRGRKKEQIDTHLDLGWEPLDLTDEGLHIPELLQQCSWIDRTVPAVTHMRGGSQEGYARWELFRQKGLDLYAAHRNNALKRDGVSRLSAYHHFGMISPFKVARDALATKSNGATKYVDEFFTWREVAHAFCFRSWPVLESTAALPQWSQQALQQHAGDPREVKSLSQLEDGQTGDSIWDAMQHQLKTHGELHNNLRMKWGKAILPWTPTPDEAIAATCHVNHKYALDGCDPCSYGGILWCFGLFDKPMGAASTPVFGVVRKMTTASITNRLNWTAYKDLGVTPFQAAPAGPGAPPGAKRDSVVMGAPQPTLDTFFKKKPRMG